MEKEYYIVVDDNRVGPLTISQLTARGIEPSTLVWPQGCLTGRELTVCLNLLRFWQAELTLIIKSLLLAHIHIVKITVSALTSSLSNTVPTIVRIHIR